MRQLITTLILYALLSLPGSAYQNLEAPEVLEPHLSLLGWEVIEADTFKLYIKEARTYACLVRVYTNKPHLKRYIFVHEGTKSSWLEHKNARSHIEGRDLDWGKFLKYCLPLPNERP